MKPEKEAEASALDDEVIFNFDDMEKLDFDELEDEVEDSAEKDVKEEDKSLGNTVSMWSNFFHCLMRWGQIS